MTVLGWVLFGAVVLGALAVDLGLLRKSKPETADQSVGGASIRSALWAGLAIAFGAAIAVIRGTDASLAYFTAYFLEESLSVDNIFVFVLIFSELRIPQQLQRGVLVAGVLGALATRGLLIASGLFILERFHWVIYPFAALMVVDRKST